LFEQTPVIRNEFAESLSSPSSLSYRVHHGIINDFAYIVATGVCVVSSFQDEQLITEIILFVLSPFTIQPKAIVMSQKKNNIFFTKLVKTIRFDDDPSNFYMDI
jgi:hypothetical protein